ARTNESTDSDTTENSGTPSSSNADATPSTTDHSNATTSVANDGASSSSNTDATTNQSNDSQSVTSSNNASRSNSTNRISNTPPTPKPAPTKNSSSVISAAKSQIGTPYNLGSKSPKDAFDCSGFTT